MHLITIRNIKKKKETKDGGANPNDDMAARQGSPNPTFACSTLPAWCLLTHRSYKWGLAMPSGIPEFHIVAGARGNAKELNS